MYGNNFVSVFVYEFVFVSVTERMNGWLQEAQRMFSLPLDPPRTVPPHTPGNELNPKTVQVGFVFLLFCATTSYTWQRFGTKSCYFYLLFSMFRTTSTLGGGKGGKNVLIIDFSGRERGREKLTNCLELF